MSNSLYFSFILTGYNHSLRVLVLAYLSHSWALLYSKTPAITIAVPKPLKTVTGLLKRITDNHMRNARLAVLATLERKKKFS